MGVISFEEMVSGSFLNRYPPAYNVIFVHQYKAFGSTFSYVLSKNYRPESLYHFNTEDFSSLRRSCLIKNGKFRRVLFGHFPLCNCLLKGSGWKKTIVISLVRDPVERSVSYFNYVKSRPNHALHTQVSKMSFSEFIRADIDADIKNGQVFRLSGCSSCRRDELGNDSFKNDILDSVQKKVTLLMPVEGFDVLLLFLKRFLGWNDIYYRVRNKSFSHVLLSQVSCKDIDFIRERNHLDSPLHQYALGNLGELRKQGNLDNFSILTYRLKNMLWKLITE